MCRRRTIPLCASGWVSVEGLSLVGGRYASVSDNIALCFRAGVMSWGFCLLGGSMFRCLTMPLYASGGDSVEEL